MTRDGAGGHNELGLVFFFEDMFLWNDDISDGEKKKKSASPAATQPSVTMFSLSVSPREQK